MARSDQSLFCQADLSTLLDDLEARVVKEVESYDSNQLLNTPIDDLCAYFVSRQEIEPIELDESQIKTDVREAVIETRNLRDGRFMYGDHQPTIPAMAYSFILPFTGARADRP
jgi:hypothetical protein